jgi:hypothetical protein
VLDETQNKAVSCLRWDARGDYWQSTLEWPVSGRVSDAGPSTSGRCGIGPASESLRRTNPRESGECLPYYGDLGWPRLLAGDGFAKIAKSWELLIIADWPLVAYLTA